MFQLGWMLHQKWPQAEESEGTSEIWSTRGTKTKASAGGSSSSPGFLTLSTFHIFNCNLISEVIFHHMCHILSVRSKTLSLQKGFTQVLIPGGGDHGELFQELSEHLDLQIHCHQEMFTPVSR